MVRLETQTHFWEAEIDGNTINRRYGRREAKGRKASKSFGSEAAARHALRALIADKLSEAYVRVDTPEVPERPEIALDDLGRDEAALVYGDWLQGRGDPRGELVMIQHAMQNARGEAFKRLRGELNRLHRAHRKQFLGDIREIENLFELKWRLGFIQEARVIADRSRRVRDVIKRLFGKVNLSRLLEQLVIDLLELESSQLLETLRLESVGGRDFAAVLRRIEQLAPPTLAHLSIPLSRHLEATLGVLKGVDDVRGARLQHRLGEYADAAIDLGQQPLRLPHLRTLSIEAPIGHSGETPGLALLAASHLPALEEVALSCVARRTEASQVEGFFDPARYPKLQTLRLHGAWFAREVCRTLVSSPIAAQLECIDFSWGRVDDASALEIARARRRFPKLKSFIIHATDVTSSVRRNLRKAGLEIDLQLPDESEALTDDRVVAMCVDERVEAEGRELAKPEKWQDLGRDSFRMWGRVYAGGLYSVVVGIPAYTGTCDCKSRKKPCKHVLAMLFMAAAHEVPEGKLPSWLY